MRLGSPKGDDRSPCWRIWSLQRATSFTSGLQSPMNPPAVPTAVASTMASFHQKDMSDQSTHATKRKLPWTRDRFSKLVKLSSNGLTNQNLDKTKQITMKASSSSLNKSTFLRSDSSRQNIQRGSIFGAASGIEQDWVIEKIVDTRTTKAGREYKVIRADTWVNEKDVRNSPRLILEYWFRKRAGKSTKEVLQCKY